MEFNCENTRRDEFRSFERVTYPGRFLDFFLTLHFLRVDFNLLLHVEGNIEIGIDRQNHGKFPFY